MPPILLRAYRVEGCPVEELNGVYLPDSLVSRKPGRYVNFDVPAELLRVYSTWPGDQWELRPPGRDQFWWGGDTCQWYNKTTREYAPAMTLRAVTLSCVEVEEEDEKGEE